MRKLNEQTKYNFNIIQWKTNTKKVKYFGRMLNLSLYEGSFHIVDIKDTENKLLYACLFVVKINN